MSWLLRSTKNQKLNQEKQKGVVVENQNELGNQKDVVKIK